VITATILLVLAYFWKGKKGRKLIIPDQIETSFNNQYPYAEEVTWYQPAKDKYEAYFTAKEVKKSVWYDASGVRLF